MDYTTSDLLASVKTKAMIPLNQDTFTENDIFSLATEELQSYIMPLVMSVREEYYLFEEDIDIVSGVSGYRIPSRAIGSRLRDVVLLSSGNSTSSLPRLTPEETVGTKPTTPAFSLRSETIILHPKPTNSSDKLRLSYFIRPSKLVNTLRVASILSIDTTAKTVTVSNVPSNMTVSSKIDLIPGKGGCIPLAIDQDISSIVNNVITLNSIPGDLVAGDDIVLAEESSRISAPIEFRTLLEQAVVIKILEALGDTEGLRNALTKLSQQEKHMLTLISPRVEGEPTVIATDIW
jgi:hypothetical protein